MLAISKKLCYYHIASLPKGFAFYINYYIILPNLTGICNNIHKIAAVVKLADALDSKSSGLILRVGSSPTSGTTNNDYPNVGSRCLFMKVVSDSN